MSDLWFAVFDGRPEVQAAVVLGIPSLLLCVWLAVGPRRGQR